MTKILRIERGTDPVTGEHVITVWRAATTVKRGDFASLAKEWAKGAVGNTERSEEHRYMNVLWADKAFEDFERERLAQ